MAKRMRWFISGTGFGIGVAMWVRKRIKTRVEEVTPLAVTKATAESVMRFKDRLTDAVREARREAERTEVTLRKEMGLDSEGQAQVK